MIRCLSCGTDNEDQFKFCEKCGTPLLVPSAIMPPRIACPTCSYGNEGNSKFCQECATPLQTSGDKINAGVREPDGVIDSGPGKAPDGITVEFSYSTSASFDLALQEAQKFPAFQQIGEGKKSIYRVGLSSAELDSAIDLLEFLKGWRHRAVYVDGKKTLWDSVFIYNWCYQNRKASYKPEFYCFGYEDVYAVNPWGCVQARMPFTDFAEWFRWGRWTNRDGEWEFDKERIRHELQVNLFKFRFCPAINLKLVDGALGALPDRVNPKFDRDWEYDERWEGPITINLSGPSESHEVRIGVKPKGTEALKKIANKLRLRLSDKI